MNGILTPPGHTPMTTAWVEYQDLSSLARHFDHERMSDTVRRSASSPNWYEARTLYRMICRNPEWHDLGVLALKAFRAAWLELADEERIFGTGTVLLERYMHRVALIDTALRRFEANDA
jgi:hypothetical protein